MYVAAKKKNNNNIMIYAKTQIVESDIFKKKILTIYFSRLVVHTLLCVIHQKLDRRLAYN